MGMLRFDLCTKSLTDEDDEEHDEEKSDENNDVQLGDTREEDEHLTTTTNCHPLTRFEGG